MLRSKWSDGLRAVRSLLGPDRAGPSAQIWIRDTVPLVKQLH
jgi:hypothetical protein